VRYFRAIASPTSLKLCRSAQRPLLIAPTRSTTAYDPTRVPLVGVGCIVVHESRILLVRGRRGLWSTPGGHLEFGETLADAAARETFEETGVRVRGVEFVALTNDVLHETGRHYITIWMRGETESSAITIDDPEEIVEAYWFETSAVPGPRHRFFDNLLAGKAMPGAPHNLPPLVALPAAVHFA
jgi:8-oxo-dGTP diphosphatase